MNERTLALLDMLSDESVQESVDMMAEDIRAASRRLTSSERALHWWLEVQRARRERRSPS